MVQGTRPLWRGSVHGGRPPTTADAGGRELGVTSVLPFGEGDAAIAGDLRAALERPRAPIGPYDLLIAAQALRTSATLATANELEFARVPGLVWQDWTVAL